MTNVLFGLSESFSRNPLIPNEFAAGSQNLMYFYIYASSATELFSEQDLIKLLAQSRSKNTQLGVTGMLLYKDGNFMQVLEGEQETVRSLANTIGKDPRHRGILELLQGPLSERNFGEWSMGFRNLDTPEARQQPGFSEFLNSPFTPESFAANPSRSQKLLMSFKKHM